jgi:hypothetical protein
MTKKFYNLPRQYSTTTGDSDIELGEAVAGCKTLAQAGFVDSDEFNYGLATYNTVTHRLVGTEVGLGKYLASDSDGGPYLQRTTVYSSILSSDSVEDTQITLTGLSEVYVPWLKEDILRVREADSDPSIYPVNTIIFSNSTVTDQGNGVVQVISGGGSSDSDAGGSAAFAIYENATVPADTNIANNDTVDPATLATEVFDASGLFTLAANVLTCNSAGTYDFLITVYFTDASNFGNGALWAYLDSSSTEPGPVNWPQLVIQTAADSAKTELQYTFGGPITLAASDTVQFGITNESGGTISAGITTVRITKLAS